jgi:hypothetical protein
MSRVTIITAGHASTCPRMLKAADALHEAGHEVHFVSANFAPWAGHTDRAVFQSRRWTSTIVDYSRQTAAPRAALTSLRWRLATRVAGRDAAHASWWAVTRAYSRAHDELVAAAVSRPADFFYGGTTGGLAVTAEAAGRCGRPYALDLEDWHLAESVTAEASLQHALADRIHQRVLAGARFLTAGSGAIAAAYAKRYRVAPMPVHNVFALPQEPPDFDSRGERLKICWFGQTLGADRGLEELIDIVSLAGVAADVDLRGAVADGFGEALSARVRSAEVRLRLLPPLEPDRLVEWCREYHVGISVEPQIVENRALCLSNKLCTYLLAGLAVVATDTPGQREVASEAGDGVAWYTPGSCAAAAQSLQAWARCGDMLRRSRQASWRAAAARWHWQHPYERGALVAEVAKVTG